MHVDSVHFLQERPLCMFNRWDQDFGVTYSRCWDQMEKINPAPGIVDYVSLSVRHLVRGTLTLMQDVTFLDVAAYC